MRYTGSQIEEIAAQFWERARQVRQTRNIFEAAKLVLPVEIVFISDLNLLKVKQWLTGKDLWDLIGNQEVNDRVMHGLILPLRGSALIFINADEPEREQRFTIAHEVAHFLLDHELPRQRAITQLGNGIREVLDGNLAPQLSEEVIAVIRGIELRQPVHPIEKDGDGSFRSWATFNAEKDADRLARELLAPRREVISYTLAGNQKPSYKAFVEKCSEHLEQYYLLPTPAAYEYAAKLAYWITNGPSFMDKLNC